MFSVSTIKAIWETGLDIIGKGYRKVERAIKLITDNFYFVERGWLNGNHFVFNGRQKVLIDAGYKTHLDQTIYLIKQAGVEPDSVTMIISTHSHSDHVGANYFIHELSGCEIAMHDIDRHFVETKNDWHTWWRYYDQEADFFPVHKALADGEIVKLGGLELVVLHVPGHGSGQIALYSQRYKFLISADAVWNGDFGALTPSVEGAAALLLQQQSLDRLAALDISVIYPGHGGVIYDPIKALDRCRQRMEKFLHEPQLVGRDQIKKIFLFTLLMKQGCSEEGFFDYLMGTNWYQETVDLYFHGQYMKTYENIMTELLRKNLVSLENRQFTATLKA